MNQSLDQRLQEFRKKYYTDKIIRGSLILTLLISSMLFIALLSEGLFGFSSSVRTAIVFGLGLIFLGVLGYMVAWPLLQLFNVSKTISDFQIANMVRSYFPNINDKLFNVLQLRSRADAQQSLVAAAIDQKSSEISNVPLSSAINLKLNNRYLWYLLIPLALILLTYLANPALISGSGHRLINYNKAFVPPPPFQISLSEVPNEMVAGDELQLDIKVDGDELPADLYIFMKRDSEDQFIDYNLERKSSTAYSYTISNVRENFDFFIGNPEVSSEVYEVGVLKRPFIKNFKVRLTYPAYTKMAMEELEDNVGDFKVIKGTRVQWILEPQGDTESAYLVGQQETPFDRDEKNGRFTFSRRMMQDLDYFISLQSPDKISNIDTVRYKVDILQDRYPSVYVFGPNNDFKVDLDPRLPLELEIADDFGFTKMNLHYRFVKSGGTSETSAEYKEYPLEISPEVLLQPLNYFVDLTALGLREGDEVEYFIKVWDNDGVSGPKSSTSPTYKIIFPTLDEKYDEVEQQQEEVKDDVESLKEKAEDLEESYKKMQEKLLNKRKLDFDDKKEVQRLVDEHQEMLQELSEAQEKFEETKEKLQENEMISQQTLEKYDELNKFLEELENPEMEEMLKQLEEQLENLNPEDIKRKLDQLELNDEEIQKSLERTLELLKQLEVQQKLDEVRNKLDNMKAKEDILNEQLERADESEELQNNAERQEELSEQMESIKEDLQKLDEMKNETTTPDEEKMNEAMEDAEEVQEKMEQASEQAQQAAEQKQEKGAKNKKQSQQSQQDASQSQQDASQKLQQMSETMEGMQMNMQMQQDQQNLESLRELLENLLKLSFDQEDLRDEVKDLKYGDPLLNDKSQNQKKLQDDMGLVKDSLDALANRIFQIQQFVLEESKTITENMDRSQIFFRNKQIPMITYHQSTAMTSINNLANMLSDVMKQIQQQMMSMMPGQGMCQNPGNQKGQMPNMQQLGNQQQQLNEQMRQMMQQGKMDGQSLSEMAARQQAIREALQKAYQQMQQQQSQKPLGDMGQVAKDMQQTEQELINKQLTHETLKRQQQILSRLLQADKSIRERDLDEKRESKSGRLKDRKSPDALTEEEYKNKIRQELLKSNKLEYSNDFIILIEQYYKKLEGTHEQ